LLGAVANKLMLPAVPFVITSELPLAPILPVVAVRVNDGLDMLPPAASNMLVLAEIVVDRNAETGPATCTPPVDNESLKLPLPDPDVAPPAVAPSKDTAGEAPGSPSLSATNILPVPVTVEAAVTVNCKGIVPAEPLLTKSGLFPKTSPILPFLESN